VTSVALEAHLSSCEWREKETTLNLSDTTPPVELVVESGALLRFHVVDEKARLSHGNLTIVVSKAGGGFAYARIASLTARMADLFVSVPLNSELAVTIDAPDSVRDATGVSIPLGIPSKTLKIAGPTEQTISFVVK
jgi:hypothetical protein